MLTKCITVHEGRSMKRFNIEDICMYINKVNQSLNGNPISELDLLFQLPELSKQDNKAKEEEWILSIARDVETSSVFQFGNLYNLHSLPYRAFTREESTVQLIFDDFNGIFKTWVVKQKQLELFIGGYCKSHDIIPANDPFKKFVIPFLIGNVPDRSGMSFEDFKKCNQKKNNVFSISDCIKGKPIVICSGCINIPTNHGWFLENFTEQVAEDHSICIKHINEMIQWQRHLSHLLAFQAKFNNLSQSNADNITNATGIELDNDSIDESTGNDESQSDNDDIIDAD